MHVCLSLLVVGGPARPFLLKEHKGNCCGSSCSGAQRCACVCLSASVLLSPGRAGQTGPVHMEPAPLVSFVVALGVFPIGELSVQYRATSRHSGCKMAVSLSSSRVLFLIHISLLSGFRLPV